jgi:biopolymer transport protein ExbB
MSRWLTRFSPILLLLVIVGTTVAFGAEAAEGGKATKNLSLFGMILGAGAPEYLLLAFSVVCFAIAIQNFMVIKREAIIPNGLADDLHNVLSKDGPTEESIENARAMVDNDPSMAGKVMSQALAVSDLGYDAMLDAAEDASMTEQTKWMLKPGYVSLFASQATLLGLFGTVWGIIESFMAMASNPAGVDVVELSSTLGIALVTTANGMAIAVPMLAFAFMQRSKLQGFFRECNDSTKDVLNYFRAPAKA